MPREIKFRAFTQDQMWSVTDINWTDNSCKIDVGLLNGELESFREWLKNIELMQYTGLKDKNGIEIYEGDIIKFLGYNALTEGNKEYISKVYFKDGEFKNTANYYTESREVIGNIYENPELLCQKK